MSLPTHPWVLVERNVVITVRIICCESAATNDRHDKSKIFNGSMTTSAAMDVQNNPSIFQEPIIVLSLVLSFFSFLS